jgi:hypothetical protein
LIGDVGNIRLSGYHVLELIAPRQFDLAELYFVRHSLAVEVFSDVGNLPKYVFGIDVRVEGDNS